MPFFDVSTSLAQPCNLSCCLDKRCTQLKLMTIMEQRIKFFNAPSEPAPTDHEKVAWIFNHLKNETYNDAEGNLVFKIGKHKLCAAGFARVIGISSSPEISKAPGQYRRLINGYLQGQDELHLLANSKIKLDRGEKFTIMKGLIEAFITLLAEFYSDSLPTAKSEHASTEIKQLPYRYINDIYDELKFQCATADVPIPESIYGSKKTFAKVYKRMHRRGLVQLVGGKSGFDTCAICNHCLAMKQSAAARRDRQTIDIIRSLQRMHIKQQQLERQHCENFIYQAQHNYNSIGEPMQWFVELDGMSLFKTLCPKMLKERSNQIPQMENRLIGARIVCGPIDTYIAICTNDLIPGGANVMIECTRIAIETLAKKLAELPTPLALPEKGGINYDNCGENKVLAKIEYN